MPVVVILSPPGLGTKFSLQVPLIWFSALLGRICYLSPYDDDDNESLFSINLILVKVHFSLALITVDDGTSYSTLVDSIEGLRVFERWMSAFYSDCFQCHLGRMISPIAKC